MVVSVEVDSGGMVALGRLTHVIKKAVAYCQPSRTPNCLPITFSAQSASLAVPSPTFLADHISPKTTFVLKLIFVHSNGQYFAP